jgi:hypothetical protein
VRDLRALKQPVKQDLEEVERHIRELFWNRYIHDHVTDIIMANANLAKSRNYFWEWGERVYADSVLVTIRRLLDRGSGGSDPISLGAILRRLINNPDLCTRAWFTSGRGPNWDSQEASRVFDLLAGSGDELDPTLWEKRLADTTTKCARVKKFVDKVIAHNDRRKPSSPLKWTEVNEAVNAVGILYLQLEALINRFGSESKARQIPAEVSKRLTSLPDDRGWDRIFRIPWIPPR